MRLRNAGKDLYDTVQPPAEAIKAFVQFGIGISVVVIFAYQWINHRQRHFNISHSALAIVGYGLAVSAAVELAYTFFTKGPDEALDPLILGLSSFTLIALSDIDPPKFKTTDAIPISLLAFAILLLFFARRFLLEVNGEAGSADHPELRFTLGLGQAVRKRRTELKLSQGELAARAGISRRELISIEADSSIPTISELQLISTALDAKLVIEIAAHESAYQDEREKPAVAVIRQPRHRLRGLWPANSRGWRGNHPSQ